MDPSKTIPEKDMQEMKNALEDGDLSKATEKVRKYLKEIENAPLNIAITGESGTGKSTFVNAIRGMGDEEESSAKTGVVETTMEPMKYTHSQYPHVTFWDLPGIGTPNFVAEEYLQFVNFDRYDFFIIMSSQRFKQNDIELAKEIKRMKKKFYFVRTKVDVDLYSSMVQRKKSFNEGYILNQIRNNCIQILTAKGIPESKVFLISCLQNELHKYDFQDMQNTLINELPDHKKHAFLLSLPNISLPILNKKREALQNNIWRLSLLSSGAAAIPIPGLSMACDVRIVTDALISYLRAFGLDDRSLENLSQKFNIKISDLKSVIKSPVASREIDFTLIISLLSKSAGEALIVAKYAVSFIPLLGTIAAGAISFSAISQMLHDNLKEIAEDAERVLKKAFESKL